jgi:hypothetical protein
MTIYKEVDGPSQEHITGPWFMKVMYNKGEGAIEFHQRLMSELRSNYTAGGTSTPSALCKFFRLYVQYDLGDSGRSAGTELLAQQLQVVVDKWKLKLLGFGSSDTAVGGGDEDALVLSGTYETRGNLGVCPEPASVGGSELSKAERVDKARREAREERALQTAMRRKGKG